MANRDTGSTGREEKRGNIVDQLDQLSEQELLGLINETLRRRQEIARRLRERGYR